MEYRRRHPEAARLPCSGVDFRLADFEEGPPAARVARLRGMKSPVSAFKTTSTPPPVRCWISSAKQCT